MKFQSFPIGQAEHLILAHTVSAGGRTWRKGHLLAAVDIQALTRANVTEVIAAKLEPGDIGEDAAAHRVAEALVSSEPVGVRIAAPFTGRCNIIATTAGLVTLHARTIGAMNAVDERVTVATLERYAVVAPGALIATIKIIPFAVPEMVLETVIARAASRTIAVSAFVPRRVGLIITALPTSKPDVLAKRREAIAVRLRGRQAELSHVETVPHAVEAIAAAIRRGREGALDPILVFSATAIVDRQDTVPAALEAAGGTIHRLGMPVDPGNLLLLGQIGGATVVGVPSCAASPKLNGFDWVLDRLLAGLPVSSTDMGAMGLGGLLKEIASRPQPRELIPAEPKQRASPKIAALVMAAGRSSRMGDVHKLLAELDGKPLVRHTVEQVLASTAGPVLVIVGHRASEVQAALVGLDVRFVENTRFAEGLATSISAGINAVPKDADGALVVLGDMPHVSSGTIDRLIAAFSPADGRAIVVPTRGAKRGNPIIWARAFFGEIMGLTGDQGAKRLIDQHGTVVVEVPMASDGVLIDIDTPEALARARGLTDPST